MKENKFNYIEENLNMNKNLFPTKELLSEITNFNNAFFYKIIRLIIVSSIYFTLIFFISMELKESIKYLVATLIFYLGLAGIFFWGYVISKEKNNIFKKQVSIIKKDTEKYKYQILLHENYRKYYKKWNIVYFIMLIIVVFSSLSLFVSDLIETNNTSFGPIFVFFIYAIVFIIPATIINLTCFKKFRKKQHHIEALIDENNNT